MADPLALRGGDGRTYELPADYRDPTPEPKPDAAPTARALLERMPLAMGVPYPNHADWSPPQTSYIQQLQQSILNLGGVVMNLAAALNMALDQIEREPEP